MEATLIFYRKSTEEGAKDVLKLVSKIEQVTQKENHCRSKNELRVG